MPALRIGSIDHDFLLRGPALAKLLRINDVELSRLARSGVLVRVPDPKKRGAYLYTCFENVGRFVEFHHNQREQIHRDFLHEKAGRERATRLKVEAFNRERAGELVDKVRLIERLTPVVVSYREQILARADRLERKLSRLKTRKEKVAALRAADHDALRILADLFKVAQSSHNSRNGQRR